MKGRRIRDRVRSLGATEETCCSCGDDWGPVDTTLLLAEYNRGWLRQGVSSDVGSWNLPSNFQIGLFGSEFEPKLP